MSKLSVGKKTGILASLLVLALVVVIAGSYTPPNDCNEKYQQDKTLSSESHDIKVEVASSDKQLEKGLSGRKCIADNQGMLFVFDSPGYYNFWMKDMNFPIDIVWVDENKRIIEVTDNVQPSTYPDTFTSNQPPSYVLEVGAGRAGQLGLFSGVKLDF